MDVKTKSDQELAALGDPAPEHEADEHRADALEASKESAKASDPFIASLLKLIAVTVVCVLILRTFIVAPFSIPSESMLPRLWNGDYLIAAKWPYGYSGNSLPIAAPGLFPRILASPPERGDIVIFKHPVDNSDYIKRVIGLPGDSIAVRGGRVILNSSALRRERIEDFVIPISLNTGCNSGGRERFGRDIQSTCAYTQFRETLPSGKAYNVLEFGPSDGDEFGPIIVPEGQMFVMGDNRDNSRDSRFPAMPGLGVGLVSQDLLVARSEVIVWSTDGSASWLKPWTWFSATRWDRIGDSL